MESAIRRAGRGGGAGASSDRLELHSLGPGRYPPGQRLGEERASSSNSLQRNSSTMAGGEHRGSSGPADPVSAAEVEAEDERETGNSSDSPNRDGADGGGHTDEAQTDVGRSAKRLKPRVSTACVECRRRKSKCDGKSPCAGCVSKRLSCTMLFDDRRRKTGNTAQPFSRSTQRAPTEAPQEAQFSSTEEQSRLRALEERCRYLESLVSATGDTVGNAISATRSSPMSQQRVQAANTASMPVLPADVQVSTASGPDSSRSTEPEHLFFQQQTRHELGQPDFGLAEQSTSALDPFRSGNTGPRTSHSSNAGTLYNIAQSQVGGVNTISPHLAVTSGSGEGELASITGVLSDNNSQDFLSTGIGHASSNGLRSDLLPPAAKHAPTAKRQPSTAAQYIPPAQSLTEEDMLEPMPKDALHAIHAGLATPSGLEAGSLAHQLTRRNGRMTLAEGGSLRYYGATSSRSVSYGGYHFQNAGRKQRRDLNAACRSALIQQGYLSGSPFEETAFQERLVGLYFQWCNSFFVTVPEQVFYRQWSKYRNVQEGNCRQLPQANETQHFSLLLLYAILACAAPLSDEAIEKSQCGDAHENAGDIFAACARICLDEEIDLPQETTVQALAILAGREVTVGKDARGYAYMGMATTCALDLGLNTDMTAWVESGHVTMEQYRVRQTTWWGFSAYERLWALYVGRPSLCRQVSVSMSLPECVSSPAHMDLASSRNRGSNEFVVHLIHLLRITDSIVDVLYSPFSEFAKTSGELRQWSQETSQELDQWLAQLPQGLQVDLRVPAETSPAGHTALLLHMQYHVTVINLLRPATCDIANQRALYNDAFKRCAAAASTISLLIERYRIKFTLRRISVVAVHQFFTAATWHVFVIYASMSGVITDDNALDMYHDARSGLLTCLGGLAALAVYQVHARRSYLMVVLLMKRWGISLNPSNTSADADLVFRQSQEHLSRLSRERHESVSADRGRRATSGNKTASEGFATLSQELFALCGDGMLLNSALPTHVQEIGTRNSNAFDARGRPSQTPLDPISSKSGPRYMPGQAIPWQIDASTIGNGLADFTAPALPSSLQDSLLTEEQRKLFDFSGMGSLNGLLDNSQQNQTDSWLLPSLADVFDFTRYPQA